MCLNYAGLLVPQTALQVQVYRIYAGALLDVEFLAFSFSCLSRYMLWQQRMARASPVQFGNWVSLRIAGQGIVMLGEVTWCSGLLSLKLCHTQHTARTTSLTTVAISEPRTQYTWLGSFCPLVSLWPLLTFLWLKRFVCIYIRKPMQFHNKGTEIQAVWVCAKKCRDHSLDCIFRTAAIYIRQG